MGDGREVNRTLLPLLNLRSVRDLLSITSDSRKLRDNIDVLRGRIDFNKGEVSWDEIENYEQTVLRRKMTSEEAQSLSHSIRSLQGRPVMLVLPERLLDFIDPNYIEQLPTLHPDQKQDFVNRLFEKAKRLTDVDSEPLFEEPLECSENASPQTIMALLNQSPELKTIRIPLNLPKETLVEFVKNHPLLENVTLLAGKRSTNTNDTLLALAAHCPHLKTLKILFSEENIGEGLRAVGSRCKITTLSLNYCSPHATTIEAISRNYSDLTTFSMKGSDSSPVPPPFFEALSRCSKLEKVDLTSAEISDEGLALFRAPNLRFLNIRHCNQISDAGLRSIGQNCPELRTIGLPFNTTRINRPGITDRGLRALLQGAPHLNLLNLWWDGVQEMDRQTLLAAIEQKEKAAQRHKMWVIAGVTGLVALVSFGVQYYRR